MGTLRYKQRVSGMPGAGGVRPARLRRSLEAARASQAAGNVGEIEHHCRRILEADPEHAGALSLLALCHGTRGNQQEAAALLARAIAADPDAALLHAQMGDVLHTQGRLAEAVACFERAIALAPDDAGHYNNLANVLRDMGNLGRAVEFYRQAAARAPRNTAILLNLAIAQGEQGVVEEAIAAYRALLDLQPKSEPALQNLADLLRRHGRLAEALDLYDKLLEFRPDLAPAHLHLGIALQNENKLPEAIRCYRKVLELQPDLAPAYNNLGSALRLQEKYAEAIDSLHKAIALDPALAIAYNNLGVTLQAQKKWEEALAAFEQARALAPDDLEAYNNIGNLYSAQEKFDLALECYARAKTIRRDCGEVDNNAGNVLRDQLKLDAALESYALALQLKPEFPDAWSNMGNVLREQGRYPDAIAAYTRAIELQPDNAGFRWNKALAELSAGDLEHGWADYGWGFDCKQRQPLRDFPQPAWEGQSLTGKTILIWGEQGVGDEIMFANSMPDLVVAADHCVIECDARLVPLFARSFPDCEALPRTHPPQPRSLWPDIDYQTPMGNLARWLRPTVASFPRNRGYLLADPARAGHWRQRLADLGPGLKVGISWRSSIMNANRRKCCTTLAEWGPILQTPGINFVNLQYCEWADDLAAAEDTFGVRVHHFPDLNLKDALDEVAALIAALDLVITIGNINMTMAGALHVPAWVFALRDHLSWLSLGTDYAPWYPSVRLFHRTWRETWEPVMLAMAAELGKVRDQACSNSHQVTSSQP